MAGEVIVRHLGLQPYVETVQAMREFSESRTESTDDEIWLLQHPPVFTQGQAGRAEHLLDAGDIPVVHTTRGGQVTYHGPGQLIAYPLLDLHRRALGIRQLVTLLEQSMVSVLAGFGIAAFSRSDAPGVYVARNFASGGSGTEVRKIGSIGLRVTRGRSYHGLALNVAMDLAPFSRINPCGLVGMRMTQIADLAASPVSLDEVGRKLAATLASRLGETASSYAH
ncbi:MAG: lipoyl(octanoyl) transferase LipB [Panacagrimonas sp.]